MGLPHSSSLRALMHALRLPWLMPPVHALSLRLCVLSCCTLETHSSRVLYVSFWPTLLQRTSRSHWAAARLETAPFGVMGEWSARGWVGPPPMAGCDLGCC